jgi:hypothetical protein
MPNPRIVLSLALLPALILAPACDEKEAPGPNTGDHAGADSEGPDGETDDSVPEEPEDPESAGPDEPAPEGETIGEEHESGDLPEPPPEDPPPSQPKPAEAESCSDEGSISEGCTTESGEEGITVCVVHEGKEVWTECAVSVACLPGDGWDQGCMGQVCAFDGEELFTWSWEEDECNTPLVLNFDGAPLRFDAATAASFDISGVGQCLSTDWPTLPWLALDRDGDGAIESGRELFGSGTVLRSGRRATHGFEALAEHDLNRDGKIDSADPVFAELVLWSDGDGDRRGELSELLPVASVDLVAIHLDVAVRAECDDRGNCGRERARFEWRGVTGEVRSGEVVDVYLACQ